MYLHNNNITDDSGIQSIIDGLKTNNALRVLFLDGNKLSDKMTSHLNDIRKYKDNGSKGYQQVKVKDHRMYIYAFEQKKV